MKQANLKSTKTASGAAALTRRPIPAKNKIAPICDVQDGAIRFYRANEKPYGVFSNLYPRRIEFEGSIGLFVGAIKANRAILHVANRCDLVFRGNRSTGQSCRA